MSAMHLGRRRGTVLMTAVFMSLFLFFLCAVMVLLNRGDIMLALGTDRHFRAQMAARSATEVALQIMRQYPDWQARLKNSTGTLEDATWRVAVTPWQDYDKTGLYWDIEGTGVAGVIAEKAHLIVEEVGLGRNLAEGSLPYVFAYTSDKRLAMMDPTMRWTILGTPPDSSNLQWLAARNGQLFTFAPDGADASPAPTLQEWVFTKVTVPQSDPYYDPSSQQTVTAPPNSRHLTTLQKKSSTFSWALLPDPGPTLGQAIQAKVDGVANGTPHYTTVTASNGSFTFSDSEFKGPVLEWYTVTGTAVAANGSEVIVHAWHHLYQGEKVKNKVELVTGANGKQIAKFTVERTDSRTLKKPAILRFNVNGSTWAKVMDLMVVNDPYSEPTVYDFPAPDTSALGLAGSTYYTMNSSDILRVGMHSLDKHMDKTAVSKGLYDMGGQLAVHKVGAALPSGLLTCTLGDLDPEDQLSLSLPAVHAALQVDGTWQTALAYPQVRLDVSTLGDLSSTTTFSQAPLGANCVSAVGDPQKQGELITFLRVRRTSTVDTSETNILSSASGVTKQLEDLALGFYDGSHWQLMPGGLHHHATQMSSTTTNTVKVKDTSGTVFELSPFYLAAAIYSDSSLKTQRRYAIVTRY